MCLEKVSFKFIVLAAFFSMLCSCAPRQDEVHPAGGDAVTDALGRPYVLRESPARIVSLSPAITEILFAIGAGKQVVGVTQYCDYPAEARTRTSIGGFSGATMSMEQIRALSPDLVVLSADMHSRIVALLDDLRIPSFAIEPRSFSQVYDAILTLGEITGCQGGAEETVAEMKTKIAAVEDRLQDREKPGVFWILSEEPLMSAGSETFISEAISLAGGRNIFGDVREQWPMVSPEQVLLRKPEWILLGDDITVTNRAIPGITGGYRSAIISADSLYRYGPRLADAVEAIAGILHKW